MRAAVVFETGAVGSVVQPDAGVDAEPKSSSSVVIVFEAVRYGEIRDRARLARLVDDLQRVQYLLFRKAARAHTYLPEAGDTHRATEEEIVRRERIVVKHTSARTLTSSRSKADLWSRPRRENASCHA